MTCGHCAFDSAPDSCPDKVSQGQVCDASGWQNAIAGREVPLTYSLVPMAALLVPERFPDDVSINDKQRNLLKFYGTYCGFTTSASGATPTLVNCTSLTDPMDGLVEPEGKVPAWRQKGFDSIHGGAVALWKGPVGGRDLRDQPDFGISIRTEYKFAPPSDSWEKSRAGFSSYGYSTTPAVGSNGTVYLTSRSGRVSAVGANGREVWSYTVDGKPPLSSPALFADYVIFQASPGVVYVLAAVNGSELFRTTVDMAPTCDSSAGAFTDIHMSSPVVSAFGSVYVGVCSSLVMLQFNISARPVVTFRWRASAPPPDTSLVLGSPAIVNRDSVVWATSAGYVFLTNRVDGTPLWGSSGQPWQAPVKLAAGVRSSPSVSVDGLSIYVTSDDAMLNVIRAPVGTVAYGTSLIDSEGDANVNADWRLPKPAVYDGGSAGKSSGRGAGYPASPTISQVTLGEGYTPGSLTRARGVALQAACWSMPDRIAFR